MKKFNNNSPWELTKDIQMLIETYKVHGKNMSSIVKAQNHGVNIKQTSSCTDLINEAISNLQEALGVCCSCPTKCTGTIASALLQSSVTFFETVIPGSASILASTDSCNTANGSLIFGFIEETGFPYAFFTTSVNEVICVDSSITVNGIGTFITGDIPSSGLNFSFNFQKNATPCSFDLKIRVDDNPPFFTVADNVPCTDIIITPC